MKKVFSVITLVLVLVLLTSCLPQKSTETGQESAPVEKETEEQTGGEESYSGSLQKMMGLGIPLKCEWKRDETYYGSSWVKGDKSYSEVFNEGKTGKVIFKDDCMWSWEEGNPQGFKMCMEPTEEDMEAPEGVEQPQTEQAPMGPPKDMNYSCRPAVFTDAKFNPPSNVNFMSMEEMMQGMGE